MGWERKVWNFLVWPLLLPLDLYGVTARNSLYSVRYGGQRSLRQDDPNCSVPCTGKSCFILACQVTAVSAWVLLFLPQKFHIGAGHTRSAVLEDGQTLVLVDWKYSSLSAMGSCLSKVRGAHLAETLSHQHILFLMPL
jgi:hypothetical protein